MPNWGERIRALERAVEYEEAVLDAETFWSRYRYTPIGYTDSTPAVIITGGFTVSVGAHSQGMARPCGWQPVGPGPRY